MHASLQIAVAAFLLLVSVATGAFGSHALAGRVDLNMLAVWQTAVQYLSLHAVALLALASAHAYLQARLQHLAFSLLLVGTLLFSGSLLLLVLSEQRWLGMITPIGGVLMLGGWGLVLLAALANYHQQNKKR
ncbi:MAG TPA: DUF423 domain-containing protein [Paenalcaligenes hominis]|uniref:DUF423 domain-containing protein n=1 Tax=Paenalcaligenes hominis TaxID=643674 RepID=A0A9D2VF64_9BURK|nr:DUF423 domain-containing protein [Paenalcaligenes hominis]NJB66194.1 uncharacterized membrane protein YgdD (TMEM256/DUF423 family) [Paenalcaligenes hominis]GGE73224.1 membrane protein [Paenalcaligenes hominis]HJH23491.1 DUF423 domain-containing protein [Paenalcaligenes hominis]